MSIIESDPGAFSFYYSALQFCSNIPEGSYSVWSTTSAWGL